MFAMGWLGHLKKGLRSRDIPLHKPLLWVLEHTPSLHSFYSRIIGNWITTKPSNAPFLEGPQNFPYIFKFLLFIKFPWFKCAICILLELSSETVDNRKSRQNWTKAATQFACMLVFYTFLLNMVYLEKISQNKWI